ncbi:MAG TPA: molecular chaperone DnaJ [Acidimicrobiales bacterium]|nr:molecular chaperone DnaJ [Acidimicrobiales bacterium]
MAPQREWFEKDYYKVLGVSDTASDKEITRAYRKLAKQFHPDANPGAEDRFKEISAAYDVLGDADRRKEYDEVRRMGPLGGFGGAGGAGGPGGFGGSFRVEDLSDLLGGIFGRGQRSGAGTRTASRRGEDLEAELHLSFTEAAEGVTTSVNVVGEATCTDCHGTGAAPGTTPTVCPDCGGRGVKDENQGFFSFSQPCRTCGGTGVKIDKPCKHCRGTGVERRARQVKVRIPAGVEGGQRIKLKGRGAPGRGGGPPGDLYVTVHVAHHKVFGRRGRDLTVTVPVTFAEAALGADIKVPTLDGPVTVRVPAGTPSGRTFRVRNRGVHTSKGSGDLLATVEVAVPATLNDDQKKAVEALAAASPESPRAHLGV